MVSARTQSGPFAHTCLAIESGSFSLLGVTHEPLKPNCIFSITVSVKGQAVEYHPKPDLKLLGMRSISELT